MNLASGRIIRLYAAIPVLVCAMSLPAMAGPAFVNFETSQGQPIALSADGLTLYAVNTPDNHLSILDPATLALRDEIPVGLEPASVRERPGTSEAWVVNYLSGTVSVVSVADGLAVATITVGPRPVAIGFTPDGRKAYVSVSGRSEVAVIDAVARKVVKAVAIDARSPAALTVSPDGATVYVASLDSGNRTRGVLPPPGSARSNIVFDPALPDHDVFAIDAATDTVSRVADHVGTSILSLGTDPGGSLLYAAHTEANNLVFGEANLRGTAIDNRLAILDARTLELVELVGLDGANPSRETAVAQPTDIAVSDDGSRVYLAAFGNAAVQVLDAGGAPVDRIDVGLGPRGLALSNATDRLYVLNRLDQTITMIDTRDNRAVYSRPIGYDPTPEEIRFGRAFLYNANKAGTGKFSCAGCHVGGHFDNLVWNLETSQDPKGPMFTQSLRGLKDMSPYHWRGERPNLASFNPAFRDLMGGTELHPKNLGLFIDFLESIVYPPNARQAPDRTLSPAAQRGLATFQRPGTVIGGGACVACHTLQQPDGSPAFGTNRQVLAPGSMGPLAMKVPHLRAMPDKTGFTHDGGDPTLDDVLSRPVFFLSRQERQDIEAFLAEFETESMPAVGMQVTLDIDSCNDADTLATIDLLLQRAAAPLRPGLAEREIEVQAFGADPAAGILRRFSSRYDASASPPVFRTDLSGDGPYTFQQLRDKACTGGATITFTGVPEGTGIRLIDRDTDGLVNRDEVGFHGTSPGNPDTDGDGLTDGFEVQTSLTNPLIGDSDGDDVTDFAEVRDGTDPLDDGSFIKMVSVTEDPGAGLRLVWTTESGARYLVEAADHRAGFPPESESDLVWSTLYTSPAPEDEAPNGTESFTDPDGVSKRWVRLYRVRIAP